MRYLPFLVSLFLLASAALAPVVAGPATPPYALLPGSLAPGSDKYNCGPPTSQATPSTFIRNGSGEAKMQFVSLLYAGQTYGGLAALAFNSSKSGALIFDFAPRGREGSRVLHFTDYEQHYSPAARVLRITFSLNFGHCIAPISAVYRAE